MLDISLRSSLAWTALRRSEASLSESLFAHLAFQARRRHPSASLPNRTPLIHVSSRVSRCFRGSRSLLPHAFNPPFTRLAHTYPCLGPETTRLLPHTPH